ncbi:hypothetical protein SAMN03159496_04689 [Rhizobium sp. NFR07]|nr:hypothetical protein SAMN03159496_04689 [Rhizobium sp. NFR07]
MGSLLALVARAFAPWEGDRAGVVLLRRFHWWWQFVAPARAVLDAVRAFSRAVGGVSRWIFVFFGAFCCVEGRLSLVVGGCCAWFPRVLSGFVDASLIGAGLCSISSCLGPWCRAVVFRPLLGVFVLSAGLWGSAVGLRLCLCVVGLLAVCLVRVLFCRAWLLSRLVAVGGPPVLFLRGALGGFFLFGWVGSLSGCRALLAVLAVGWCGVLIFGRFGVVGFLFFAWLSGRSVGRFVVLFGWWPFFALGLVLFVLGALPTLSSLLLRGVALGGVFLMVCRWVDGSLLVGLLVFSLSVLVVVWPFLVRWDLF